MATMAAPLAPKPTHGPAARVVDFDPREGPVKGQAQSRDVLCEGMAFQGAHSPIFLTPCNGGRLVIRRYDGVHEAALAPSKLSAQGR